MKIISKEKNKKNGITLIALVITIVILIILASVTIILTLEKNGIINRTKFAKETYLNSENDERENTKNIENKLEELLGNRNNIETKDCIIEISDYNVLTVKNVNNLYAFLVVKNDKPTKIIQGSDKWEELSLAVGETSKLCVYAVDTECNFYKSNIVNKTGKELYVENGLILNYDGIKNTLEGHNSNSNGTWYDLKGTGNNATLYNCTVGEKSIIFSGSSSYASLPSGALGAYGPSTIEVTIKSENTTNIAFFLDDKSKSSRGIGLNTEYEMTVWANAGSSTAYPKTLVRSATLPNTYSAVYNGTDYTNIDLYQNAILQETNTSKKSGFYNTSTNPLIGKRNAPSGYTNYYLKGEIYAIRVYNRQLSEAEIRTNHNTDKARFGI